MTDYELFIGVDERELDAVAVAAVSAQAQGVDDPVLWTPGLAYETGCRRPVERRDGRLWCPISDAPMSTRFANTRFAVAHATCAQWAIFVDGDVMFRYEVLDLLTLLDDTKAVMCVQHDHAPLETVKMDEQVQTRYSRKNWSSVMAINRRHPANRALTLDLINTAPGRDLHAFCWLEDAQIGALPAEWNYLVGHTTLPHAVGPAIVHWTDGVPSMPGRHDAPYADEWREWLKCAIEYARF